MRRDELYLNDILEAADNVAAFLIAMDCESFLASELVRSAVVQKLLIIGEAAGQISGELTGRYREIPWAQIVGFRNVLIHAYFGIDWAEVWKSATVDCPELRHRVAAILATESGAD